MNGHCIGESCGIHLDRGFIGTTTRAARSSCPRSGRSVDIKLNVVGSVVRGRRIVVVDHSVIRGTTWRRRLQLLRAARAREIPLRISAPPCRHPCFHGIDFPSHGELIAAKRSAEDIRTYLEVDTLGYQTVEGMLPAVSHRRDYCTACFTGRCPGPVEGCLSKQALESPALAA